MKRKSRQYSIEFKEKAVELSKARGNISAISKELGIPRSVLSRWCKESAIYGKNSFPGSGHPKMTDEQKEIAQLKKALREAQMEADILKKAISIFSVSDRKSSGL